MDAAGVALVCISIGTPDTAANFCRRSGFPADNLYCDPERSLYLDMKLNQGWMSTLFSWGSLQASWALQFPGLSIFKDSMQEYDRSMTMPATFDLALQQGGLLVLDSSKKLVYFHSEQGPGDLAPVQDVLEACCS